jgi:hypothetical protein
VFRYICSGFGGFTAGAGNKIRLEGFATNPNAAGMTNHMSIGTCADTACTQLICQSTTAGQFTIQGTNAVAVPANFAVPIPLTNDLRSTRGGDTGGSLVFDFNPRMTVPNDTATVTLKAPAGEFVYAGTNA